MTRALSAGERDLLRGDFNVHSRLTVEDASGTMVDLATFAGAIDGTSGEHFIGGTWNESVDQACATGTITLFQGESGLYSLAPLMDGSAFNAGGPLLYAGRRFVLSTATVPLGTPAGAGTYRSVFEGRVDEVGVNVGDATVTLQCRDTGGWALNSWIEAAYQESVDAGQSIQTTLNNIASSIITPANPLGVSVFTPSDPGWFIKSYQQEQMARLDALRRLAQQIGWDIRYRYYDSGGGEGSFLVFSDPGRAKTTPDLTFGPGEYERIPTFTIRDADVRNVIEVRYPTATGEPQTEPVIASDPDSINKYGRRYMRIWEDASSNIDTSTEATDMANAALSDLKDPLAEQAVEMPYFWPVQLNDLARFEANGVLYDSAQDLAVVAITHTLADGEGLTTLQCRGTPASAHRGWLRSTPRKVYVGTEPPTGDAPDGTLWCQVESIAFP